MSAYVVVHASILDQDKFQEYGAAAGPTLAEFGGELACRGPATVLAGESPHQLMVVLRFPDRDSAERWYTSPAYQALIPTREQAMDAAFVLAGD